LKGKAWRCIFEKAAPCSPASATAAGHNNISLMTPSYPHTARWENIFETSPSKYHWEEFQWRSKSLELFNLLQKVQLK